MPLIPDRSAAACLVLAALAVAGLQAGPAHAQPAVLAQGAATPPQAEEGWPKISFDTLVSVDAAQMHSTTGPNRDPGLVLWSDSTLLVEFDDALSVDALFQFKPREPLPASNPNNSLFINRGLDRQEGGKMKELYVRYGDWRLGKFVQNFGRAYALLPGPYASDFVEEPEEGYEPSDMMGLEKIYVFDDESWGWRQLSFSAFLVDRTFLHESFPYNEGLIHLRDGGVGNTRWPENLMATYDVLNRPVGNWGHLNYQASVIRWGRTQGAARSEWWTALGADLSIPLAGSVEDTLRGGYSQLRFYAEAARRDNFEGVSGRARTFLSGSAEYMAGPWVFDLTTTQRWTRDRVVALQKDEHYSAAIGYTLPSQTVISLSAARQAVGGQSGLYMGLRLTQSFTLCSKCLTTGSYF